jgi:hypothetical protein
VKTRESVSTAVGDGSECSNREMGRRCRHLLLWSLVKGLKIRLQVS